MEHAIKLQPEYYNYVLNGTTSFLKRLLHYSSFVDMFKDFDIFSEIPAESIPSAAERSG